MHWARLEASALGSLIAAYPAWKRREEAVLTHKAHTTGKPTYLSPQPAPSTTHRNLLHTFIITPTAYRSKPVNCVCMPSF